MNRCVWPCSVLIVLVVGLGSARADVSNGSFDADSDGNHCPDGWTCEGAVALQAADTNNYVVLREPDSGGLSRIWQTTTVPDLAGRTLEFTFQFTQDLGLRSPAVPPDSFTAFLIANPESQQPEYLLSIADPDFIKGLLYTDSDLSPQRVALLGSGVTKAFDGSSYSVQADLSSIPAGTPIRIEFGLANAANGVNSFVALDGVSVFSQIEPLCDPEVVDDHDPCTDDNCNPLTGEVTHIATCADQCHTCRESAGNVIIMIDRTSSTSQGDLDQEKLVARNLLGFFAGSEIRPHVAIGTFNNACTSCTDHARMLGVPQGNPPSYLTTEYGISSPPTGLYELIDGITVGPSGSYTDVGQAIAVGASSLPDASPGTNYIILISDGWTNAYIDSQGQSHTCSNLCICSAARTRADTQATDAKTGSKHATIMAVHYIGHGGGNCQDGPDGPDEGTVPDNIDSAIGFMHQISSGNDYFFEGSALTSPFASNLICTFYEVVQRISCDDGNPATWDCCQAGACLHGASCGQP